MVFDYPRLPHARIHGPRGYRHADSYKPWLRDEFVFRCVYCLCRERWLPDGDAHFSVEHLHPQHQSPGRRTDYDNLAYACCQCNATRAGATCILDPCDDAFGRHLEVLDDGTVRGLTREGLELIQTCRLDRPKLTSFRRGLLECLRMLKNHTRPEAAALLEQYLGYPANLPRLTALRPPGGNVRARGIAASAAEKQRRGELPAFY